MTKKQKFINFVEGLIAKIDIDTLDADSKEAIEYFNILKSAEGEEKQKFTENGKLVLTYIQQNYETNNNMFKAKDIGEGLNITSRTASGAMRKLVTDGYLEKIASNPVIYSLTDLGKTISVDE
jgi:DNA-binding MarR family transcriptional regulator